MKLKFVFLTLIATVAIVSVNTSCVKKTDCDLEVSCADSVGNPIAGTLVQLYANVKTNSGATVQADLKAEGTTDGSGKAKFTFKLPAILDIKATLGTKTGVGIIKLEEGKKVEKSVTVK